MKHSLAMRIITLIVAACMIAGVLASVIVNAEKSEVPAPIFSHEGGIYAEEFDLSMQADDCVIYYTTDGSLPDESSKIYTSEFRIDSKNKSPRTVQGKVAQERWEKGIVIRAVAVNKNGEKSSVVTNTYFVSEKIAEINKNVPVVAISANPYDFWDANEGIYANYENEKKITGYAEYFDTDGTGFERGLELKISGHGSRSNPKKSIRLYFTKGDAEGRKNLEYDLIESADKNFYDESKVKKYGKVTFRISDWTETDLKDPMAQSIAAFTRADTAASTPAAVFINGEFWGIYEMREQYDNRYLDYHYEGIDKDDVIFLDRDWTNEGYEYILSDNGYKGIERITYEEGPEEDEQYYLDQYNYVQYLMLSAQDDALYEELEGYVDIDNFIDYLFVYFYTDNIDWPGNNFKFWRTSIERSNGDTYAADGKWRFMVHDFDLAFDNANNNTLEYALKSNLPESEARHPKFVADVLDGLFKNENFRNRFAQRSAAYLDSAVSVENITAITQNLIDERDDVKAHDLLRWNNMSGSALQRLNSWIDKTQSKFIGFAQNRNSYFEKMIADFYRKYYNSEIGEKTKFVFETDSENLSFDIDGAIIRKSFYGEKAQKFETELYMGIPVTITAECDDGYIVKSIVVNGERFDTDSVSFVPENKEYSIKIETALGEKKQKIVNEIKIMREKRFENMKQGEKLPIDVIAVYEDGTSERVYNFDAETSDYGYDLEEAKVVAVSDNAVLTAQNIGSAVVTVTYGGAHTTFDVMVG